MIHCTNWTQSTQEVKILVSTVFIRTRQNYVHTDITHNYWDDSLSCPNKKRSNVNLLCALMFCERWQSSPFWVAAALNSFVNAASEHLGMTHVRTLLGHHMHTEICLIKPNLKQHNHIMQLGNRHGSFTDTAHGASRFNTTQQGKPSFSREAKSTWLVG